MATFVGRHAELEALSLAVERASTGSSGSLSVIEGEGGIGKTRLCEEVEAAAARTGARVAWSHSQEGRGEPAYWPWSQLIRSLSHGDADGRVAERLEHEPRTIAARVPELRGLADAGRAPPGIENERDQFQLRDSICALVLAYAAEAPLLLILDDLHWADLSSLTTLSMLVERVRSQPVALIGTTRPPEPGSAVSTALTGLKRSLGSSWLRLSGLTEEHSKRLFENISAQYGSTRVSAEALHLSEGNPFFLTELASSWDQLDLDRSLSLPASAVDVVNSRLAGVPTDALNILHTASLLGREFDFALLCAVSPGSDEEPVAAALETGLARRIVELRDAPLGLYRFVHEITRQGLLWRGSATDRAGLHAQIAGRLESHLGDRAAESASEIAYHLREAGESGDMESQARWSISAGKRALAATDVQAAAEHFEFAADRSRRLSNEKMLAESQEGLGRSLTGLERTNEAVVHLREAFEFFERERDYDRLVSIARMFLSSPAGLAGMASLQERALQVAGIDERAAALIKVPFARALAVVFDDYGRATELLDEVIELGRRSNDPSLEMYAAGHGTQMAGFQRRREDMRDYGQRVLTLGSRVDDPFSVSAACTPLTFLAFLDGRLDESDALVERGREAAERTRVRHRISSVAHFEQRVAVQTCRWEKARAAAGRSTETGFADPRVQVLEIAVEFQLGNFEVGVSRLEQFLARPLEERRGSESISVFFPLVFRCTLDTAHIAAARTEAEAAMQAPNPYSRIGGLTALGWVAVEQRDRVLAADILEQLGSAGLDDYERAVIPPLAHVAGEAEASMEGFERLLPLFEDRGDALTAAWMRFDFARLLIDHPALRPGVGCSAFVSDGRREAVERGLVALGRRFDGLVAGPAQGEDTHGLSRRELEVLRLLAAGNSNRQIAGELFISPATVNRHVSNLFSKLDVSNRAAATDLAHRLNLVD